jgi:hypothetical protein
MTDVTRCGINSWGGTRTRDPGIMSAAVPAERGARILVFPRQTPQKAAEHRTSVLQSVLQSDSASTLRLRFTRARHRAHLTTPPARVCGWPGASSLGGAA